MKFNFYYRQYIRTHKNKYLFLTYNIYFVKKAIKILRLPPKPENEMLYPVPALLARIPSASRDIFRDASRCIVLCIAALAASREHFTLHIS